MARAWSCARRPGHFDITHSLTPLRDPGSPPFDATAAAHRTMCIARQDFLRTWRAWLATQPARADVAMELDGTTVALRDLVRLLTGQSVG